MKRSFSLLNMTLSALLLVTSFLIHLGNAKALDFDDHREVQDYSRHAAMERQAERNRKIELQRYQQREYLEQQQQNYEQDSYNRIYQRHPDAEFRPGT